MTRITRDFSFSAAHRIEGHPKCGRLHGHNYAVTVVLDGPVGADGMVIDFGHVDQLVKPIIDGELDHRYLVSRSNVNAGDPYAEIALRNDDGVNLPINATSAECLAEYLAGRIAVVIAKHYSGINVGIRVKETDKSVAIF